MGEREGEKRIPHLQVGVSSFLGGGRWGGIMKRSFRVYACQEYFHVDLWRKFIFGLTEGENEGSKLITRGSPNVIEANDVSQIDMANGSGLDS